MFFDQTLKKLKRKELKIVQPSNKQIISNILEDLKISDKEKKRTLQPIKEKSHKKKDRFFQKFIHQNLLDNLEINPKISIIMPVYNTKKIWLEKAILSVINQEYRNWELCIVDDFSTESHIKDILNHYVSQDRRIKIKFLEKNLGIAGASNEAIKLVTGEFVTFLDSDDEITDNTLYEIVKELNLHNDAAIIYSDDAKIDQYGNIYDYQYKPDWSPELLLSYSYFSHIVVYKKSLFDNLGGFRTKLPTSQDYDFMLRATEKTNHIYHIPKILYYWRAIPGSTAFLAENKPDSIEDGRIYVQDALDRRGISGKVIVPDYAKNQNGIYKIEFELKEKPKVSIIIPTKDKLKLLKNCIDSIEKKVNYQNYEIIILDTGSKEKQTLEYLDKTKHKVIKLKMDKFNFSRANNLGASQAKGDYILFMNNDIEIINPKLIEEMLGYMETDEKIGIVSGKLWYQDGKVQHAGVILGINGIGGHANKLKPDWDPGYLFYAHVARNFSAVTAAMLMIRKSLYQELHGMDEKNLTLAYNDLDLCLKAIQKGYRIVCNPYALAYHHEGQTRGTGKGLDNPDEEHYIKQKWFHKIRKDPYYNPNLSLENEQFEIKKPNPSAKKILFVSHNLNYEGAPRSLFLLANELKQRKAKVTILSPMNGPLLNEFLENDIDVVIEPSLFSSTKKGINFAKNFDCIYANTILNHRFVNIAKLAHIPVVWCIRESEREHYVKEGVDFEQFKNADSVTFVADATQKIYSDLNSRNNFRTIPNGLDLNEIESFKHLHSKSTLRKKYAFSEKDVLITIVGTVIERKGQLIFVQAAIELLKKHPKKNLKFLIVGCRENNYLRQIKELIKQNNVSQNIFLIPETNRVFDYYLISDLFVCTSIIESFPRITLEAMAFGLPIIATNVYGIPEQIKNNVHGILIPPNDSKKLAKQIQHLLDHPQIAKKYAFNAYERLKNEFTLKAVTDQYVKLFKRIEDAAKDMEITIKQ